MDPIETVGLWNLLYQPKADPSLINVIEGLKNELTRANEVNESQARAIANAESQAWANADSQARARASGEAQKKSLRTMKNYLVKMDLYLDRLYDKGIEGLEEINDVEYNLREIDNALPPNLTVDFFDDLGDIKFAHSFASKIQDMQKLVEVKRGEEYLDMYESLTNFQDRFFEDGSFVGFGWNTESIQAIAVYYGTLWTKWFIEIDVLRKILPIAYPEFQPALSNLDSRTERRLEEIKQTGLDKIAHRIDLLTSIIDSDDETSRHNPVLRVFNNAINFRTLCKESNIPHPQILIDCKVPNSALDGIRVKDSRLSDFTHEEGLENLERRRSEAFEKYMEKNSSLLSSIRPKAKVDCFDSVIEEVEKYAKAHYMISIKGINPLVNYSEVFSGCSPDRTQDLWNLLERGV